MGRLVTVASSISFNDLVDKPIHGAGSIIQQVVGNVPAISGNTTVTLNNNVPVSTVGVQIMSAAIIPTAVTSKIVLSGSFQYSSTTAGRQLYYFVFRGTTFIGSGGGWCANTTSNNPISINMVDFPASTSSVVYTIRVAGASAHTWFINQATAQYFAGGLGASKVFIKEISV